MNVLLRVSIGLGVLLAAYLPVSQAETITCPCKVVEIVAGDSVYIYDGELSSRKIWLAGIDAPQLQQLYGEQARKNLSDLVLGKYIDLDNIQRDRYGRVTARIIKDDQDINLQQIEDGFAWYYPENDGLSASIVAQYQHAQEEARAQTKGLWESRAVPPWEFRGQ
jgi:endonuclease YncB( thermonuclease family)